MAAVWPLLGALAIATAPAASAADADGNYAVRGLGGQSCERFTQAAEAEQGNAGLFVHWMAGYMTGLNRSQEETFDVSPILDNNAMGQLLLNVCADNPDVAVETATARLLNTLAPARVRQASEVMQAEAGERRVAVRRSTLAAVQQELQRLGHYGGGIDGIYGSGSRNALEAYQESEGLTVTGLPDPATLVRLLAQ